MGMNISDPGNHSSIMFFHKKKVCWEESTKSPIYDLFFHVISLKRNPDHNKVNRSIPYCTIYAGSTEILLLKRPPRVVNESVSLEFWSRKIIPGRVDPLTPTELKPPRGPSPI